MLRMQKLLEDFKIQVNPPICVYPTIENVLKSYEGLMAGGSLPYNGKQIRLVVQDACHI
jgi:hypothetical protein